MTVETAVTRRGSARDEVLRRVRSAIDGSTERRIPRDYRQSTPADIELLVDRLVDYKAVVHRCAASGIADVVGSAIASSSITRLAVPVDLDMSWVATVGDGVELLVDDGTLTPARLDGDDVAVLTACRVAIAETGTIVLDAGAGQGRRLLTLVPDHHLCVVRADQVVGGVPDAVRLLDARRPLTWISGPSATSDIELRRVEGVHGPRHLVVVVVEP